MNLYCNEMDIESFKKKHPVLFKLAYRVYFGTLFKRFDQFSQERLKRADMKLFKMHMGYSFDLNNPKTFCEKIQWYAFNWHYEEIVRATDKVLFKDYIEQRLGPGYTIPLIGTWTDIRELEKSWKNFPDSFVIKSNLSADGNGMKIILDKSKENPDEIIREVKEWLNPRNSQLDCVHCNFYRSTLCILVEEYRTNGYEKLSTYKFFCFDGEPYCVYVNPPGSITFYSLDWQKLDVRYGNYLTGTVDKPKHFDEMIEISRKLSAEYPFVRVDFFDTDEQLYLSELTFNPGGGMCKYTPESFNEELGAKFNIREYGNKS